MIHLAANNLIGLLVRGSQQAVAVVRWLSVGQVLGVSAIARTDLLNGPVKAAGAGT
jgi:hypothetical protein